MKKKVKPTKEDIFKAAQYWCDRRTANLIMQPQRAEVFAKVLATKRQKAREEALNAPEVKELIRLVMKNSSRFETEDALSDFRKFRDGISDTEVGEK